MKFNRFIIIIILAVIALIISAVSVSADTGPKPTLVIFINNADDEKYYLDLLGKEGEYRYFGATDGNREYDNLHDQPIYKYNEDGWKAILMRTWLLKGKLAGEPVITDTSGKATMIKHSFGYVGVPKKFRIIIQKSDGSLQVSDEINNNYFNTVLYYDMKDNKVLSVSGNLFKKEIVNQSGAVGEFLLRMLITVLLEMLIALPFFYKNLLRIPVIALVNLVTQTLLTADVMITYSLSGALSFKAEYYVVIAVGEVFVFVAEYLFYIKKFGKVNTRRIFAYTLVANLASFLAGYVIL